MPLFDRFHVEDGGDPEEERHLLPVLYKVLRPSVPQERHLREVDPVAVGRLLRRERLAHGDDG
eukprot:CAMPEP_0177614314 /NCGR_PEP_ID=MMETSP0419_2-20121207/22614_1 /TAXON_ID=582737 /ORGANISM="Tetraselmis sp., Strain GSL018" /LENGTH=62 /DNA_ID=CAMNT_0019111413 /DNA_START=78 /DNA_END=262 /DNA_ORIENTATION=+